MQSLAAAGARQQQLLARRPGAAPSTPRLGRSAPPLAAAAARRRRVGGGCRRPAAAADEAQAAPASSKPEEIDLEEEVERFMLRQAELESGAAFARTRDLGPSSAVIGADAVPDDEAKRYCRAIVEALRTLKETRDMSVAEIKLVVSIDDPRARERAVALDVEDSRGVSRDEMAGALAEVAEGRVPRDRIALRCLHDEILAWPFLNDSAASVPTAAGVAAAAAAAKRAASGESRAPPTAADYASLAEAGGIAKPYVMGKDARQGDKPQGLADLLPDWVGFGALYGISAIPVFLAVGAILVLFYNSLR